MQIVEPRGPVGTQGRLERQKKMTPDEGELMESVRGDGRAGEKVRKFFYSIHT